MASKGKPPAEELVALLNRIAREEGSLNRAADAAGINRSSYQRVANGLGGFSEMSAARLEAAFGARYRFTARQVREWGLGAGPEPEDAAAPDPVPPDVRVYWSRVQDEYGPEEREVARAMDRLAQRAAEEFRARRARLGLPSKGYVPPADLGA